MSRITKTQFAALLLIGDAFAMLCIRGSISLLTAAGFVIGTVLQLIIAIPLIRFYSCGTDIKASGSVVQFVYMAYLIGWGGMLFSLLWDTSEVIYIPYENGSTIGKVFVAGVIGAVCLYITSTGMRAISRSGFIAAGVGAAALLVFVAGAAADTESSGWTQLGQLHGADSLLHEILRGFALSGGLGSFGVLLGFTKGDHLKNAMFYFGGKALFSALLLLTSVIVAGGVMEISPFPVVMAAQLSQPFPVQRIDSLFLIVFAVCAVFSAAVTAASAAFLLKEIFQGFERYRCSFVLVLMIAAGLLMPDMERGGLELWAAAVLLITLIVPTEAFISRKRRQAA